MAAARRKRVPTPALNKFIEAVTAANPPVSPGRKHVRIMYAAQIGVAPPSFVFFTNVATTFHFSYERFLDQPAAREVRVRRLADPHPGAAPRSQHQRRRRPQVARRPAGAEGQQEPRVRRNARTDGPEEPARAQRRVEPQVGQEIGRVAGFRAELVVPGAMRYHARDIPLTVQIRRLPSSEGLALPVYMTPGAAGMDLHAAVATMW